MKDQHEWSMEEYSVQIVYHLFSDQINKTFNVSFEVRDYDKRYCLMANLSEEMFLDLMMQYTRAKEAGYVYDNMGNKFKKGKDKK